MFLLCKELLKVWLNKGLNVFLRGDIYILNDEI